MSANDKWLASLDPNERSLVLNIVKTVHTMLPKPEKAVATPAKLGQDGEILVLEALQNEFNCATRCSDAGHRGDIVVVLDGYKILVEVKNWERTVAQREIDKFYSDILDNNRHAGLFISLKSRIVGQERNVQTKYINSNRGSLIPCCFVSETCDTGTIINNIYILRDLARMFAIIREGEISQANLILDGIASIDTARKNIGDRCASFVRSITEDLISVACRSSEITKIAKNAFEENAATTITVVGGNEDLLEQCDAYKAMSAAAKITFCKFAALTNGPFMRMDKKKIIMHDGKIIANLLASPVIIFLYSNKDAILAILQQLGGSFSALDKDSISLNMLHESFLSDAERLICII